MRRKQLRQGAVAVEFALMAPVFLTMILGVIQASQMFEMRNQLSVAAREGARLAAMERPTSTGTNSKVTQDVKNYLAASGLDPDDVEVQIVAHDDPTQGFNLDDPANDLKYFEVHVSVPYSGVSGMSLPGTEDYALGSKIVFRNGKANTTN